MPDSLKLEADLRFLDKALDRADVLAHGRLSYEGQPNSPRRRRLVLTRHVADLEPDPNNANARFWNPAGALLEEACEALGCRAGMIAVIGGPFVFSLFLKTGYDRFYLSRAVKVELPGGVPVFEEQRLDDEVTLVEWAPAPIFEMTTADGAAAWMAGRRP